MSDAAALPVRRVGRFAVQRLLGAGAFGQVLEAEDTLTGDRVALKRLRTSDPMAIYRFKQEFRALADVIHPNLVRLHDLFVEDGEWWLTMDVVDGDDLLTAARKDGADLRGLLRQLVAGVAAIHRARQLHRDLKPANVRVTPDGRVVILDFGLARPVGDETLDQLRETRGALVGTPMYLAPELIGGAEATEASDWYAVGVILYVLLSSGHRPFSGTVLDVLSRKEREDAPDVRRVAPAAPADLADLCARLMARAPDQRPGVDELAAALGVDAGGVVAVRPDGPFVGRVEAHAALEEALVRSRDRVVVALVRGDSGAGKSTLVNRFLRGHARDGVRILRGRCYERESMPFKGVDGLIDAVARAVVAADEAETLTLPPGLASLAQVFPAFLRLPVLRAAAAGESVGLDPVEVRRLGFGALARLLAMLTVRGPTIAFIDDLQWGDADSVDLLAELLTSPAVACGLFVIAHRAEDDRDGGIIATVRERMRAAAVELHEIELGPLDGDAALEVVRASLDDAQGALAHTIVGEAGGNPFLLQQLARACARHGGPVRLSEALDHGVEALGASARLLLEVVAAAGHPLDADVARRAADLRSLGAPLAELRLARLVRSRDVVGGVTLECFHDRVRAAVTDRLDREGQRAARHLAVADALEASGRADAEQLADHFRRAGRPDRAQRHAEAAAEAASAALAFERAAALWQIALDGAGESPPHALRVKLAEALVLAGRPREAGDALLAAATSAPTTEAARALRRRAADQLLQGGYVAEGIEHLRRCLAEVGLTFPSTPTRALLAAGWQRARVRLRLWRAAPPSPLDLERIDTCFAAGLGLSQTSPYLSVGFLSKHLVLAMRHDDPARLARGLAMEAVFTAALGAFDRGDELIARARAAAARSEDPRSAQWPLIAAGQVAFLRSHWRASSDAFREMLALAERDGAGAWEVGTAKHYLMMNMTIMGEYRAQAPLLAGYVRDAADRGDLYTEISLRAWCLAELLLSDGRPAEAAREATAALARWTGDDFQLQHAHELCARAQADLYAGDARAAYDAILAAWPRAERSGILRIRLILVRMRDVRARAALAVGDAAALRDAARQAGKLAREGIDMATAGALQIRAALAVAAGRRDEAVALLEQAEAAWAKQHVLPRVESLRRQRGVLLGDRGLVDDADARLVVAGVKEPERFAAVLAPGLAARRGEE